jgi:hypothetical protein
MAMRKSIGRTFAQIDVAANFSVRIHEDFFNISNEVGRVKRDLIFFLVRTCTPHPWRCGAWFLGVVPCVSNPLARPVLLINSVLLTKHLSDHYTTMMIYSNSPHLGEAGSLFSLPVTAPQDHC